ncbi:MAG: BrnT family toxin [Methanophagales archaeon]|nr:BrnT family toxin [Methanophagales archaeon]
MKRRIRIEITEGAKKHIASHNVRAEEVITIFERNYFVKREGKRYELIGRTRDGRFLALFMEKGKDKFKLVTARDATKTEKELYKKKVK